MGHKINLRNYFLHKLFYTPKASDSSMIGGIGNKSVAMKALDSAGEKILSEIQVRLPKEKSLVEAQ